MIWVLGVYHYIWLGFCFNYYYNFLCLFKKIWCMIVKCSEYNCKSMHFTVMENIEDFEIINTRMEKLQSKSYACFRKWFLSSYLTAFLFFWLWKSVFLSLFKLMHYINKTSTFVFTCKLQLYSALKILRLQE